MGMEAIEKTISVIADSLKPIRGIAAVALGGSRARGGHNAKSDIDIGIYYQDETLFDLQMLNQIASDLDDTHRPNLITKVGEWGPWINGGGWLTINGTPTDFLFRDLNKVGKAINDCCNEIITIDYQPGHPHGFINAVYMAETYFCKILWESNSVLTALKSKTAPYPLSLKKGIIQKFQWEVGFFLIFAQKAVLRQDVVYSAGCFYRIVSCLIQVLYALNETYIMNENGALSRIDSFETAPRNFTNRINNIFINLSVNSGEINRLIEELSDIVKEVEEFSAVVCT